MQYEKKEVINSKTYFFVVSWLTHEITLEKCLLENFTLKLV